MFSQLERDLTGIGTLKFSGSTTRPLVLSPLILSEVFSNALFYVIKTTQRSRYWEVIEKAKKLTLVKRKNSELGNNNLNSTQFFITNQLVTSDK